MEFSLNVSVYIVKDIQACGDFERLALSKLLLFIDSVKY